MAVNFDLDLLYALYQTDAKKSDNKNGLIDIDSFDESVFSVSGDEITITEADGDVFVYNISDITDLEEALAAEEGVADSGTTASVQSKASEIRTKYCKNITASTGDPYSASNPELMAFKKAMNDGVISQLGKEGFSKTEIVDIVNLAFPSIGIANGANGEYSCPWGHGAEAKEIYDQFVKELSLATGGSEELNAAKDKLNEIYEQIDSNNHALAALEQSIIMLQTSIENDINEAIAESEEIEEDQKEESQQIVSRRMADYTKSNGKISYEEFKSGVTSDLDKLAGESNSKLSAAVSKILDAQKDLEVLDGYLTKMNSLIESNKSLTKDARTAEAEYNEIKNKIENDPNCGDECCQRCDPIGFKDENGTSYDFFVDKDNNGDITNENEFLGAQNGFSEMKDLDTNGDNVVDASELEAGNVKVVVTNKDGSQEIKNASEVLKEGDNIDLSSYQAKNEELDNGNAILGNFSVNFNGKTLDTGYQTMDTLNWLDDNFEFTDEIQGNGRHTRKENNKVDADDYSNKYLIFKQKYNELKAKADSVEEGIKGGSTTIDYATAEASSQASLKGQQVEDDLDINDNTVDNGELLELEEELEEIK